METAVLIETNPSDFVSARTAKARDARFKASLKYAAKPTEKNLAALIAAREAGVRAAVCDALPEYERDLFDSFEGLLDALRKTMDELCKTKRAVMERADVLTGEKAKSGRADEAARSHFLNKAEALGTLGDMLMAAAEETFLFDRAMSEAAMATLKGENELLNG